MPIPLLKLLNQNKERSKQFSVRNEDDQTAHVYLYDTIGGYWGIEAEAFIKELNNIKTPNITLHINCPGGDVFDGRAMATAIKQHASQITAQVDGLCASAATFLSTACHSVSMAEGAFYMIHEGWTLAVGNKRDLQKTATLLEKVDASILNDYEKKTGQDRQQLQAWVEGETWFSAEEAKENGFADSIIEEQSVENHWNLSAYNNPPQALIKPDNSTTQDQTELLARLRRQVEALAMSG